MWGRGRGSWSLSSMPAWSKEGIAGQLGAHSEALLKQKQRLWPFGRFQVETIFLWNHLHSRTFTLSWGITGIVYSRTFSRTSASCLWQTFSHYCTLWLLACSAPSPYCGGVFSHRLPEPYSTSQYFPASRARWAIKDGVPRGLELHTTIYSVFLLRRFPTPISPRESGQKSVSGLGWWSLIQTSFSR